MSHQQTRRCFYCHQSLPALPAAKAVELDELKSWIQVNRPQFKTHSPDEMAWFALQNGFSKELVYELIPEAHRDFETHSTYKLRHDYHVGREFAYMDEISGKPSLEEPWHHLGMYLTYGKEFEEADC